MPNVKFTLQLTDLSDGLCDLFDISLSIGGETTGFAGLRMGFKSKICVNFSLAELYYLIARFLEGGPCKRAAQALREEIDEHKVCIEYYKFHMELYIFTVEHALISRKRLLVSWSRRLP